MIKKLLLFAVLLFVQLLQVAAQVDGFSQAEILKRMQEKNVSREELEDHLKKKGYNPNSYDLTNPVEANNARLAVLKAIDDVAADKSEKAKAAQNKPANDKKPAAGENEVKKDAPGDVQIDKPVDPAAEAAKKPAPPPTAGGPIGDGTANAGGGTLIAPAAGAGGGGGGQKLPPAKTWGQQVFRDKQIGVYQKSNDVKPPSSYILGIGDRVAVSIWGFSQLNVIFEINEEGYIKPEAMPRIYLKGISFGKAKELIEARFHQYYRFLPEEFEVTLNFSRVITVNVVGEVFTYGSFTLPARNTAFNALAAAGGPTDIGSVRNIKLIRAQQPSKKIDIYEFLLNPSAEEELFLSENDYIHVPMADRLVNIAGTVRRPDRYELIEGENLKKLIEYAGGLTVNAHTDNIEIVRTVNGKETFLNVNLTEILAGKGDFNLQNEDVVRIKAIKTSYQNVVKIGGTVEIEGEFELLDSMRVGDLVKKSIPKKEAQLDFAMLIRQKEDGTKEVEKLDLAEILDNPTSPKNFLLKAADEITIYPQERFVDNATLSVEGAVRAPRTFPYDFKRDFTVENMVALAGGLHKEALNMAYIHRTNFNDRSQKEYIKINIVDAVNNPASPDNLVLQPNDRLVVYSKNDFTNEFDITVAGSVNEPGNFPFEPGLKIADVIYFTKGLNLTATDFGYIHRLDPYNPGFREYIRVNVREAFENPASSENVTLAPKDRLTVYAKGAFIDNFTIQVKGEVRNPQEYPIGKGLTLRDALTMSGGLKYEAAKSRVEIYRVLIGENLETRTVMATYTVDENLNIISGGSTGIELQPYDQVYVRKVPSFELQRTVSIQGEVFYPGLYPIIDKNEKVLDIVKRAGGLTLEAFAEGTTMYRNQADEKGFVLIRLDKLMNPRKARYRARLNYVVKPGDVISIPKTRDLVVLKAAHTNIVKEVSKQILEDGQIQVPYFKGKRAKWYVKNFMGGKSDKGSYNKMSVIDPNGKLKKPKNYLLFRLSPKVRKGAIVRMGTKTPEVEEVEKKEKQEKEIAAPEAPKPPINWGVVLQQTLTTLTATLTTILLIQRLD